MDRNLRLYPWFEFCRSLLFWQATWFLYLQGTLSASEAILLYAIYDVSVTVLEVPSGYMSDRLGRRVTLICAGLASMIGVVLLAAGGSFWVFALAQACIGAGAAFVSGTNTALLYETLSAKDDADQMERHSLTTWRYGFVGLAVSAVSGGAMAVGWEALPFWGSALAFAVLVYLAWQFTDPPRAEAPSTEIARLTDLIATLRQPVLRWLFVLGVLMYGYSHIPFVFGQPFIAEALEASTWSLEAPLVSGLVTALMMVVSLGTSLVAPGLRARLGLGALLLVAFGMQVGLALVLSLSGSVIAIAYLLLRMVPDSLSTPFIEARIQPLLDDGSRATFMSVKSLFGRMVFAASLAIAASYTDAVGEMSRADLQTVLMAYAIGGIVCLALFILTLRRISV